MLKYNQVSGGNCRLVLLREASAGIVDESDTGVVVSFFSETLSSSTPKSPSAVISSKRGTGKPVPGQPNVSGGLTIAPYAPLMGHFLRALCSAPTTENIHSLSLAEEAVHNEGKGYVGLPCVSSPYVQDAVITITGTAYYNGVYRVEYGSTPEKIIIKKKYTPETLPSTATAHRGRGAFLSGSAKSMGAGKVGLPVAGIGVTLNVGESMTISGSTAYDGVHVLQAGTTNTMLVITETYVEEVFDGTAFAIPKFYKHSFALPKKQPSVTIEKRIDYDTGASDQPFSVFGFSKVNGLSFSFGGENELQMAFDFSVGSEVRSPTTLAPTPEELPPVPFYDKEVALWVGETRMGDVEKGSLSLTYGIESKTCVGDMGRRTLQSEGDPNSECSMTVFLQHDEYVRMAEAASSFTFQLCMCGAGGEEFWFTLPDAEMEATTPTISGKSGMTIETKVIGFSGLGDNFNKFTLINRVPSYA